MGGGVSKAPYESIEAALADGKTQVMHGKLQIIIIQKMIIIMQKMIL